MSRDYPEICSRIESGIRTLENAKAAREHAAEQSLSTLTDIQDRGAFNLTDMAALREFFHASETAAAKLRDQVPLLVADLDELRVFFQQPEVHEEKSNLWSRILSGRRRKPTTMITVRQNNVNPQEAFERATHWNTVILEHICNLVTFVDGMQDRVEDAIVEPKAFVIDLVRRLRQQGLPEHETHKIEASKLCAEDAIAMAERHLVELSLLKREFSDVVEQLQKNESENARVEDSVVNIFHPDDVKTITGKSITAYDL